MQSMSKVTASNTLSGPHRAIKPVCLGAHHRSPFEAAERLRTYAEMLEARNKPARARKLRQIAAKITLQQQNEVDGFPLS